jgi:hypothetical protein
MIEWIFLQVGGYGGGFNLYNVLNQWEASGVFDLVLPFLLIMAVIFAILSTTNILGSNRGINIIIAIVIGLFALRLGFVQAFFTEVFPRLGVALAVILVGVILVGLFIPQEWKAFKGWFIFFGVVAAVIAFITNLQAFAALDFLGSQFWQEYASTIVTVIFVVAIIIGIVLSTQKSEAGDKEPSAGFQIKQLRE